MGCNMTCIDKCSKSPAYGREDCFATCNCGNGVIKFTPGTVNTASIVEKVYGDVTKLSTTQLAEIKYSIKAANRAI